MGVPKLFKWLKDRYPLISQSGLGLSLRSSGILPTIDDLFIDANSIIHSCTHPEYGTLPKSEAEMFYRIGRELDTMVAIVAPRRMFFVAVDGVAPRAKLNQQRSRRFRAAAEAAASPSTDADVPAVEKFDPNAITPGTPFMARLSVFLRSFLQSRLKEDMYPPKVVYSGQEIPGEGEHKIMDEIRSLRSQKALGSICIHGLDADLIMLALASHHYQFVLLREQRPMLQRYGNALKREPPIPESLGEMTFDVLHVSILRDYLKLELFSTTNVHDKSDDIQVASDFVLLAMLAGNDFLPHLPGCHIDKGSLDLLLDIYKNIRQTGEYLTSLESSPHISSINWSLLARILISAGQASLPSTSLIKGVESASDNLTSSTTETSEEDDNTDVYENYYAQKLSLTDERALEPLFLSYVRTLLWAWIYYYDGLASWTVFYPYHYAPLGRDLGSWLQKGGPVAHGMLVPAQLWGTSKGTPLRPLEQLLGVLPIASGATLLPLPLFDLMSSEALAEWYPLTFTIDANEKLRSWEHIVLIPFIDEKRLLNAVRSVENKLTPQEKNLNRQYVHSLTWSKGDKKNQPYVRALSHWSSLFLKNNFFSSVRWGKTNPRRLSPPLQLHLLNAFSLEDGGEYCIQCLLDQVKKGTLFSNWPHQPYPLSLTPKRETYLRVFGLTDGKEIFYESNGGGVQRRDLNGAELDLFSLARRVFSMKSIKATSAFSNDVDPGLYFFGRVERGNQNTKDSKNLSVNGVILRTGKDFFIIPPAFCMNLRIPPCSHTKHIWKREMEKNSRSLPSANKLTFTSSPYDYFVKASTTKEEESHVDCVPMGRIVDLKNGPIVMSQDGATLASSARPAAKNAIDATELEAELMGLAIEGPKLPQTAIAAGGSGRKGKDHLSENLKAALGIGPCKSNHK